MEEEPVVWIIEAAGEERRNGWRETDDFLGAACRDRWGGGKHREFKSGSSLLHLGSYFLCRVNVTLQCVFQLVTPRKCFMDEAPSPVGMKRRRQSHWWWMITWKLHCVLYTLCLSLHASLSCIIAVASTWGCQETPSSQLLSLLTSQMFWYTSPSLKLLF